MHSTKYIYGFTLCMTVVVALVLAGLFTAFKSKFLYNEAIFNKKAVLSAVNTDAKKLSDDEVLDAFKSVTQVVLNSKGEPLDTTAVKKLKGFKDKTGFAEDLDLSKEKKADLKNRLFPLYQFKEGNKVVANVIAVRGNGLWDEIWGYIAFGPDFNTIKGTAFDHKAETPGLGAEIKDNPSFPASFVGDQIFDKDGKFVSVLVKKGGAAKTNKHAVDGISGATVTCDGVTKMLEEGIGYYLPYINAQREKLGLLGQK